MAAKKVNTLFLEEDSSLESVLVIAIHSSIEVFRLVYLLNKQLDLKLSRETDLDFKLQGDVAYHPLYHYEDIRNLIDYYLVVNRGKVDVLNDKKHGLLFDSSSIYSYVMPEYKSADFLLKIEGLEDKERVVVALKHIKLISTFYLVELEELKSYNNLIFN